jgi:hypothetical protein
MKTLILLPPKGSLWEKAPSHEGKDLNSFSLCGALRLRALVAGLLGRVASVLSLKFLE